MSDETNDLQNIVIFVADEMRGDTVNNPHVKIPNIESIAEDGVIFTNNFTVNPVCGPSRVCTFTGQYPHNGGHRSLYQLLQPHDENLFKMLKNKGYEVIWIGRNDLFHSDAVSGSVDKRLNSGMKKMTSAVLKGIGEAPNGQELMDKLMASSNIMHLPKGISKYLSPYMPTNPYPMDHRLRKSFYFGERTEGQAKYDMDQAIIDDALKYLKKYARSKSKKPFCLYIALNFPHPPYYVEEPYFSMYDRNEIPSPFPPEIREKFSYDDKPKFMKAMHERYGLNKLTDDDFREILAVYYGMISKVDFQIGQVLEKLKEIGVYDNTVIAFFADHGDYAGSYGLTEKWAIGVHDCLLNVPLIVKIPGVTPSKKNNEMFTETIDVFQTLLEVAKIETPYTHFSKSLIPAMKGEVEVHRDAVFMEGGYDPREPQAFEDVVPSPETTFTGIYYDKTNMPLEDVELNCRTTMIRTKEWKLAIRSAPGMKEELYDLKNDPQELVNLIDVPKYSDTIKELKERILYWYLRTSDNPHWAHQREP